MTLAQYTKTNIATFSEDHPYVLPVATVVIVAVVSGGIAGAIMGSLAAETVTVSALPITAVQAAAIVKFGAKVVPLLL